MRTVKLHIDENIYKNVMFLLENLKLDGLKIEEDSSNKINIKNKVKNLLKSKDIQVFENIKDPIQWQKEIREDW